MLKFKDNESNYFTMDLCVSRIEIGINIEINELDESFFINKDQCLKIAKALYHFIEHETLPDQDEEPLDRYLAKFREREGESSNLTLLLIGICEEIKNLKRDKYGRV